MGARVDWANAVETNVGGRDLDTIYITGAGYIKRPFKGISRDSAMGWGEPVWGGDLTRSTDFVLSNITDVDFGVVARCEVSYKYMNIDDYKALCEIAKQRVCYVIYFDKQTGEWVTGFGDHEGYGQEMAFTDNEISKLYTFGTKYLGGTDIAIKMVATNRDKSDINTQYTITYNLNGGSGTVPTSVTKTWSDNLKVASPTSITPPTGRTFSHWNTAANGTGKSYLPNQEITIYDSMTLYAQWQGE